MGKTTGPNQVRSIPNTTERLGFFEIPSLDYDCSEQKLSNILLLNNDYNSNRSTDYYVPLCHNTSDKTFRTAITLLRPLSNELYTTLHHPQHQLSNTYVSVSVNIRH